MENSCEKAEWEKSSGKPEKLLHGCIAADRSDSKWMERAQQYGESIFIFLKKYWNLIEKLRNLIK